VLNAKWSDYCDIMTVFILSCSRKVSKYIQNTATTIRKPSTSCILSSKPASSINSSSRFNILHHHNHSFALASHDKRSSTAEIARLGGHYAVQESYGRRFRYQSKARARLTNLHSVSLQFQVIAYYRSNCIYCMIREIFRYRKPFRWLINNHALLKIPVDLFFHISLLD